MESNQVVLKKKISSRKVSNPVQLTPYTTRKSSNKISMEVTITDLQLKAGMTPIHTRKDGIE